MSRLELLVILLLPAVLLAASPPARADEATPILRLEDFDLLPLSEFELQDLRAAHPQVVKQIQGYAYRIRKHEKTLGQRKKKDDEGSKKLRAEIGRLRGAAAPVLSQVTEALRSYGLTDALLDEMRQAPTGAGRVERYARRLVRHVALRPEQRVLFGRVIPEVNGAYLAVKALTERTQLALKQSELDERMAGGILNGFRRQSREIDRRFWRLVDYVLDEGQKAALWEMLPASIRKHDSSVEHVYALSDLTPAQGARIRALVTEIEAESAPDQALTRRIKVRLRQKDLPKAERQSLSAERGEAYQRLAKLKRRAHEAALEILTDAQVRALKAIPPRVSINDRRANGKRVFEGIEFDPGQLAQVEPLRKEGKVAGRRYQARVKAVRREGADIGPDSPEMMMMEMMMAGARGEAMATQRELLGRVFLDVLKPDEVSGWVMGLYGYRR